MAIKFSESLKRLRKERDLSQFQLANLLNVDRSTVASWETGRRIPDALTISKLAELFHVDVGALLSISKPDSSNAKIIVVDDEQLILEGSMSVIKDFFVNYEVVGFNKTSDAITYVVNNHVSIAFLDIEMGRMNGFDLCTRLLEIDPCINIYFLTAYPDYSINAWKTKACGFLLKPLNKKDLETQLKRLHYPIK